MSDDQETCICVADDDDIVTWDSGCPVHGKGRVRSVTPREPPSPGAPKDPKDAAQELIAALKQPRAGQVYRHYKGDLYTVLCVSAMEDTGRVMVTYTGNLKGGATTRTLEDFTELVTWPVPNLIGSSVMRPRFMRENR